MDVLVATV
jgi:hypothetical protein